MKKLIALLLVMLITLSMIGCSAQKNEPVIVETIVTDFETYYKMSDGTWKTDAHSYQYRLEIRGRLNNAVADITYVYLSNMKSITFDQAWKASGLSSNLDDYFSAEDASLVDMWVHE